MIVPIFKYSQFENKQNDDNTFFKCKFQYENKYFFSNT